MKDAQLRNFIESWKINKTMLATCIGMPQSTFLNKFSDKNDLYSFTAEEEKQIKMWCKEMAKEARAL